MTALILRRLGDLEAPAWCGRWDRHFDLEHAVTEMRLACSVIAPSGSGTTREKLP